jgi:hypothetical protein
MKILLGITVGMALMVVCAIFVGKFIAAGAAYGDEP